AGGQAREVRELGVDLLPAEQGDPQGGVKVDAVRGGEVGHERGDIVLGLSGEEAAEDLGDPGGGVRGVRDTGRVGQTLVPAARRGRGAGRPGREEAGAAEGRGRPGERTGAEHRPPRGSLLVHVLHPYFLAW